MDEIARSLLGLGLKPEQLDPGQAALRAAAVYLITLAIVRLGKKRMMARATPFDVIVTIVIGSIAGRAITANAPIATAMAGVAAVVAVHWIVSVLAMRSKTVGRLVKGNDTVLIRDGELDGASLRHEHMTQHDLAEELRQKNHRSSSDVQEARLERSGQLSVISAAKTPKFIDIDVRDGVQTVRIEIK